MSRRAHPGRRPGSRPRTSAQDLGRRGGHRDPEAPGQPLAKGGVAARDGRRLGRLVEAFPADLLVADGDEPQKVERRAVEEADEAFRSEMHDPQVAVAVESERGVRAVPTA
jgi:hypothetical protein